MTPNLEFSQIGIIWVKMICSVFPFLCRRPEDQHRSLCNRSTLVSTPCLIINFVKESIWLLSSNKTNTGFFFTTLTIFISVQISVRAIKSIRSLEHSWLRSSTQPTYTTRLGVPRGERVLVKNWELKVSGSSSTWGLARLNRLHSSLAVSTPPVKLRGLEIKGHKARIKYVKQATVNKSFRLWSCLDLQ